METETVVYRHGGLGLGSIITGMLVALGAMVLLSALAGGILFAVGVETNALQPGTITFGAAAGLAFVISQFLAYLWGGYTAGRMTRGSGSLHGLLVPLTAIIIGAAIAGVVAILGARAQLNLPYESNVRFGADENLSGRMGIGFAVAGFIAMMAGGWLGGAFGGRWRVSSASVHVTEDRRVRL